MQDDNRQHYEAYVIATLIEDTMKAFPICVSMGVDVSWFHLPWHSQVYVLAKDHFSRSRYLDYKLVQAMTVVPDNIRLTDYCGMCDSLPTWIEKLRVFVIREKAELALTALSNEIKLAQDMDGFVQDAQERFRSLIQPVKESETLHESAVALLKEWSEPAKAMRFGWPFDAITQELGGVTDELIFIAARESVGKTAFVLQWMLALQHQSVSTSLASLESGQRRIVMRLLSNMAGVNTLRARQGKIGENEQTQLRNAADNLKQVKVRMAFQGQTIAGLRAWGYCEKAAGSQALFIDNLKHIRPARQYKSPVEQFRDMSAELKWLRDDLQMPIIVLHHLNKGMDVSWSDDIRRDADILIILRENEAKTIKPEKDNHWIGQYIVDFAVAKNRDGLKNFSIEMEFIPSIQTFKTTGVNVSNAQTTEEIDQQRRDLELP